MPETDYGEATQTTPEEERWNTCQTYQGSITHIDVSLASSQLATKCRWATFNNTMRSDHVPIIITINARPERQRITAPTWKSADADWNVFCDCINDQINTIDVTERRRRPAEQQDRRYYLIGSGAKYSRDETIGLQTPEISAILER